MTETFFISDTHFGHKGIIGYEAKARPFATIEEHDEALADYWNETVSPEDTVFHLGDFCLGKRHGCRASALNGKKTLIMGNHDLHGSHNYLAWGFERVFGAFQYESMILTHVPVHPSQMKGRFWANLHGHLHSKELPDWFYLNVSVEQTNLRPIPFDEVISRLTQRQVAVGGHPHD